jgi:NADPH2:quinone reductase
VRAIVLREFGPPERLVPEYVPDPEPRDGEVVLDVEIASITYVETQIRAGRPPVAAMAPELPMIPGNGVGSGRFVSTTGGRGGYAERVAVPEAGLIEVPARVGLLQAVALLADGRTATGLMRAAQVEPGDVVLVHAAAGGVGSLLVQLAATAGARVIAAAGGSRKLLVARDLGADRMIDYTREDWASHIEPVDVVFDGVGGEIARAALGRLRDGGRFVPFGAAAGRFAQVPEHQLVRMPRPDPATLLELTRSALAEAAAGQLRPVIGQTFPLERAADAHAAIESRATIGKTLLIV